MTSAGFAGSGAGFRTDETMTSSLADRRRPSRRMPNADTSNDVRPATWRAVAGQTPKSDVGQRYPVP